MPSTLVGQRVFGIALGYEDPNDHDQLRRWFHSMAYVLMCALHRIGLHDARRRHMQTQTRHHAFSCLQKGHRQNPLTPTGKTRRCEKSALDPRVNGAS
jgi:hypothetical protein